ncbi:MAG TPA: WecB/TagA/CpsF family glycosyltransferase [Candidatus Limnocylindria bacterium]
MSSEPPQGRTRILGVPLDPLTMDETVARVVDHVDSGRPGCHMSVNAATLILARDDPQYLHWLEQADIAGADGQSVVTAAHLLSSHGPDRVTGIDLMERLLGEAQTRGWSVYLLGARPRVVARLARRLERRGISVAGYRDGYFGEGETDAVLADIRRSGAHILFVGIPTPRKERFLIEHARPAGVPFSVGVGGSFDVLAGLVRRAPHWMQASGLEWLFRLAQEPGRLWRRNLTTNSRFMLLVARELIRVRLASRPSPGADGSANRDRTT